jgi:hypothetical protein
MKHIVAFFRFWYDFIVGDDWRVAAAVVTAIALTALVAGTGVAAWWLMPVAVVVVLYTSLRRATQRG